MKKLLFLCFYVLFLFTVVQARQWTGNNGKTLEAELLEVDGTKLKLLKGKKTIIVDQSIFTKADQDYVKLFLEVQKRQPVVYDLKWSLTEAPFKDGLARVVLIEDGEANVVVREDGNVNVRSKDFPGDITMGCINKKGELITSPKINVLSDFSDGLALFKKDGLFGYINTAGKVEIPAVYKAAKPFINGGAIVDSNPTTKMYNFSGIPLDIDFASDYGDDRDLIPVKRGGKWGYVDRDGRKVIDFIYSRAGHFISGKAKVYLDNKSIEIDISGNEIKSESSHPRTDGNHSHSNVFYYNTKNKRVSLSKNFVFTSYNYSKLPNSTKRELRILARLDSYLSFPSGLEKVYDVRKNKYGFIDRKGITKLKCDYDYATNFSGELALVYDDDKFFYINTRGDTVIEVDAVTARPFNGELAPIKVGVLWGVIDNRGKQVIPAEHKWIRVHPEGFVTATKWIPGKGSIDLLYIKTKEGYKSKVIDDSIIRFTSITNNRAAFKSDPDATGKPKYGFMDSSGEVVIDPIYDEVTSFYNGRSCVCIDDKWGVIDTQGKIVIKIEWDQITNKNNFGQSTDNSFVKPQKNFLISASNNARKSMINTKGEVILNLDEYHIRHFSDGLVAVYNSELRKWGYMDHAGKLVMRYEYAGQPFINGLAQISGDNQYLTKEETSVTLPGKPIAGTSLFLGETDVLVDNKLRRVRTYFDREGTMIFKEEYGTFNYQFKDGMLLFSNTKGDAMGVINGKGEVVVKPKEYRIILAYENGYAVVRNEKGMGLIDKKGDLVIECKYKLLRNYSDGLIYAVSDKEKGYMDLKEKFIITK